MVDMMCCEGVHKRPPQDVLCWRVDYFERMAIKMLQAQGKLLPLF